MNRSIELSADTFPELTRLLGETCPPSFAALGDLDILRKNAPAALFCSNRCPPELVERAHELAQTLRDKSVTVISGFHTQLEVEALEILLRGSQPIIFCEVRSLETLRIPNEF